MDKQLGLIRDQLAAFEAKETGMKGVIMDFMVRLGDV